MTGIQSQEETKNTETPRRDSAAGFQEKPGSLGLSLSSRSTADSGQNGKSVLHGQNKGLKVHTHRATCVCQGLLKCFESLYIIFLNAYYMYPEKTILHTGILYFRMKL